MIRVPPLWLKSSSDDIWSEKDSFNYNVLGDKVVRDIKHVKTSDDQNIIIYVGVGLVAGIIIVKERF